MNHKSAVEIMTEANATFCCHASCGRPSALLRRSRLYHDVETIHRNLDSGVAYVNKVAKRKRMSEAHRAEGEMIASMARNALHQQAASRGSVDFYSGIDSCPNSNIGQALSLAVADWSSTPAKKASRALWRDPTLGLLTQLVPISPAAAARGQRPLVFMPGAGLMRLPWPGSATMSLPTSATPPIWP